MTEQEAGRYLELVDRRLAIITSGRDWRRLTGSLRDWAPWWGRSAQSLRQRRGG